MKFELKSQYKPAGDQPKAIQEICHKYDNGENQLTLLGATGTGKTFTMANVIQHIQKPTLIISHNKTLAAQLATEFKQFFPNNAVHYFVSYFDYYQPESYLPDQGLYIEKEATINQEIEMYRLATMASLLSRKDVIVVASVSSLYGLGEKNTFKEHSMFFNIKKKYEFGDIKSKLLKMQYKPMQSKVEPGTFEFRGDMLDIYSSTEKNLYRLHFNEDMLELIEIKDSLSFKNKGNTDKLILRPATQFLQRTDDLELILSLINKEMEKRIKYFENKKMLVEAERVKKRVGYDIRMIRETGFVNGIENYSPYFDRRLPGETPNTLFDYFPDDCFVIFDESHMTIPQLQAMPKADKSRKGNLIKFGFRLPSAIDHRPLNFEELEFILGRKNIENINTDSPELEEKQISARQINHISALSQKHKINAKTLFASATPASYEIDGSKHIVEQVIRPTGLLDPITYVYPKSGDNSILIKSISNLLNKKPYLKKYLETYDHDEEDIKNLFETKSD